MTLHVVIDHLAAPVTITCGLRCNVLALRCAQDLHVLRGLLNKREAVLTKLERAELRRRASKPGDEPKVWTGACFGLGQRVDAVAFLTEELSYYNTEVRRYHITPYSSIGQYGSW